MNGKVLFLNYHEIGRPIEEKYVAEVDGIEDSRRSFIEKADALMYLFDNGVKTYKYLTKEEDKYKSTKNLLTYEFWHIKHRVGYVTYDYEPYIDNAGNFQKKRAYVFRFVGYGKSCFAETKEELEEKVLATISEQLADSEGRGLNEYPYFTRYYREG